MPYGDQQSGTIVTGVGQAVAVAREWLAKLGAAVILLVSSELLLAGAEAIDDATLDRERKALLDGTIDLAEALRDDRPHRTTGEHAAHVVEIAEAIHASIKTGRAIEITSTFPEAKPFDWA